MIDGRVSSCVPKFLAVAAVISLLGSIAFAVWCAMNRLKDFRLTARIARRRECGDGELDELRATTRRLGEMTWKLWKTQVVLFAIGVVLCATSVVASAWMG